ncbi:MAG: OmpA family protein [Candidatus Acidiferrales bacterium]
MKIRFVAGALLLALCSALTARAQEQSNILSLSAGATVLAYSAEYGGGWSALNLISGSANSGWCSPSGSPNNNYFLLELPQRFELSTLTLDNAAAQESGYPGISARSAEVWVSTTASDTGFRKAGTFEAPKGGRQKFSLPAGTDAQWLKIVIVNNWGHAQYTELMKVEAEGHPMGSPPALPPISGTYDTNYGPLRLEQHGTLVTGCYYGGSATVSGATDGRTMDMEWTQAGSHTGSVLMVLDSNGDFLNGVWYENGSMGGEWFGKREANPGKVCDLAGATNLEAQMKGSGRAILYGIRFRSDSAELGPESNATLLQIAALMKSQPQLRIGVEGFTDSTNTDAYNMDLSRRRAQAVVAWLTQQGISSARLTAQGLGKSRPVADNATPQGRALNRRVEIVALH